jgi:hypothetical protein
VLAAVAGAGPIRAQVPAPALVEDGDAARLEPAPAVEEGPAAAPARPRRGVAAAGEAAPAPAPRGPKAPPVPTPGQTPPGASAPSTADRGRRIAPVRARFEAVLAAWAERRAALRESDPARAEAAQRALLAAQRELAIENLAPFAAVEVREARRALAANLPSEALARAEAAVALAPDHPDGHLARARALLALSPAQPRAALSALWDGLRAAAREPHTRRAFLADVLGAGLAAVLLAAGVLVVILLLRSLRLFLHDFHHLPLLRGSARAQAALLALVLLALPLLFGLGPLAALALWAAAAWLYLSTAERLVVTAALGALLAAPLAVGGAARLTAWTGTLAERVHEIEHGSITDAEAAALAAWAPSSPAPAPLLAALGRHAKRRGDLEGALRRYRAALALEPRAAGVLVNVANVLLLQGDLDGARAAYLAGQDAAGTDRVVLGTAHYGLSKLYIRTSEMDRSAAAREKAEQEAGAFLRRHGSDEDYSANRWLVDVPVPAARIAALATVDGAPDGLQRWARGKLLGRLPAWWWPWGGVGAVAALWLLGLAGRALAPAHACPRCGRPACRRCDGAAGERCGQCVNVFERKGVVDVRDRLRKEATVRRHEAVVHFATRALSVVGAGAAQVYRGAPVRGAVLLVGVLVPACALVLWRGVAPPPYPSSWALAAKLAVALPLGGLAWGLAVLDAFRGPRS